MFNNKNKILSIDICKMDGTTIYRTDKNFIFPKDLNSTNDSSQLIIVKGKNLPELDANTLIYIIAYLVNGDRVKYLTKVKISTDKQLNAFITDDNSQIMQERRRFFKIKTNENGFIILIVRDGEALKNNESIKINILDINIGGIFISSNFEFQIGDNFKFRTDLYDERLEAEAEVLRIQKTSDGTVLGYGCKFSSSNSSQEELITRYIYKLQLEERRRRLEQ